MKREQLSPYERALNSLNGAKRVDETALRIIANAGRVNLSLDQIAVDVAFRLNAKAEEIRLQLARLIEDRHLFLVPNQWPTPSFQAPPDTPPGNKTCKSGGH